MSGLLLLELLPAVAAERHERVACEALAVEADGDVLLRADVAVDERGVFLRLGRCVERDDLKVPKACGKLRDRADLGLSVVGDVGEDLLDTRLG